MAIGNPFNGTLRGRLGESVFSRKAGAQHVRAYVQKPANPQSKRQLAQRVKFGTCAKFYQHGVQNLFKFAFEFKKPGQDDYNAFLQANVGHVPCNTRKAYNMGMPNLGRYVMSQGSLPSLSLLWGMKGPDLYIAGLQVNKISTPWDQLTIGDLSAAIIDTYGLQQGDFLTFAVVTSGAEPSQSLDTAMMREGLTEMNPELLTSWKVRQFTLDVNNQALASSLGIFYTMVGEGTILPLYDVNEYDDPSCQGVCAMVSRNTPRGVKVSTSRLMVNIATAKAIEVGMSDEWTLFCADKFVGSTSTDVPYENILQGSISENTPMVNAVYSGSLPVELKFSDVVSQSFLGVTLNDFTLPNIKGYQFIVNGVAMVYCGTIGSGDTTYYQFLSSEAGYDIDVDASNGKVFGISNKQGRMLTDIRVKK